MFEFHGWANVLYHTHDTNFALQDHCWDRLSNHVRGLIDGRPSDRVRLQRHNGCDSVTIDGQHNHRSEYVIELFRWIAENAPGSYGLLYIRDDEDQSRGADFTNCFRAWRLCRGELTELDDPFLSPAIPTVEDPYDESRGD